LNEFKGWYVCTSEIPTFMFTFQAKSLSTGNSGVIDEQSSISSIGGLIFVSFRMSTPIEFNRQFLCANFFDLLIDAFGFLLGAVESLLTKVWAFRRIP